MGERIRFGELAVEMGFLRPEMLEECLHAYVEDRASGRRVRLGEIVIERGHITSGQVSMILEEQGRRVKGLVPGYEIVSKLGEGGMGAVYRARVVATGRLVALKLLLPDLAEDEEFRARFLDEARVLMTFDHPNIVMGVDFGEAAGTLYLATRYIEGETAEDKVNRSGPMMARRAMEIALGVAKALEYASSRGLVHRDVKPDNVIIERPTDTPKLADLGLAKFTGKSSVTKMGQTWGTPAYMSPEQARGERHVDVRSDIYSLGAALYHLSTGVPPFSGKSAPEVLTMHLTEDMQDPKELWPEIPLECVEVIRAATIKDRSMRYQSPREMEEDLAGAIARRAPKHAHSRLRIQRAAQRLPREHRRAARLARSRRMKIRRTMRMWGAAGAAVVALVVFLVVAKSREPGGLKVEGEVLLRYTFAGPAGEEWHLGGVVEFDGRKALRGEKGLCRLEAAEGEMLFALGERTRLLAVVWTRGTAVLVELTGEGWTTSARATVEAGSWSTVELGQASFTPRLRPERGEVLGLSVAAESPRPLVIDEVVVFDAP